MKSTIRALLLGSAAGVAMTGAALAADLSRPPPPAAYAVNWGGLYFGVNGGYVWTDDPVDFASTIGLRPNASGPLFGGQLGYNWQCWPEWVFGVEADLDWANIFASQRLSTVGPVPGAPFDPFSIVAQQRVSALGTLRGRVGYALENVLLYGTGGVAYGRTELATSVVDTLAGCGPAGFCATATSTQWMVGWAAGVGFDWSFLPRWSFRTEYLHYDLGSRRQDLADSGVPGAGISASTNFRGDLVRGAISFKLY
jgi:outer membrane immunogenic protein